MLVRYILVWVKYEFGCQWESRGAIHATKIPTRRSDREKLGATPHSTKIPTGPTGKSGPLQNVDQFFETFPVGPNRSIEFWTEISRNFDWMDRVLDIRNNFRQVLLNIFQYPICILACKWTELEPLHVISLSKSRSDPNYVIRVFLNWYDHFPYVFCFSYNIVAFVEKTSNINVKVCLIII